MMGKNMATKKYKEYIPLQELSTKLKGETQQEGLEWKHNKSVCVFTKITLAP
jgi:hypothetical protein